MRSFFLLAAALGTSAAVVPHAPLKINTPVPGAAQCEPLLITWSGGIRVSPCSLVARIPYVFDIVISSPLCCRVMRPSSVSGHSSGWLMQSSTKIFPLKLEFIFGRMPVKHLKYGAQNRDEKRAYTLGIASTSDGDLLPLEQVWGGLTDASLPTADADGYEEAQDRGFHFTVAASKKSTSLFSTEKTMEELLEFVIQPHIDGVIADDPDLDEDQKSLFYIDIYPVHTSMLFRTYCILQPQDVGIQRVAKHHPMRCPRKASYNLSSECLTSRETRKALRKYLENDTILAEEVKARLGPHSKLPPPSDIGINAGVDITDGDDVPKDEQDQEADDIDDDTGVPLPAVVDRVLRVRVQDRSGRWVAKGGVRANGEARISAADAEENIWAYNPRGELCAKGGVPADESESDSEGSGSGDDYDAKSDK
ncbi:hypothetical protein B0H19DRAFT_1083185 [Mycena capillaripes]|nr:hypothetical protein B0H19DRAFT_1083185 [Mycena capillaripes]